MYQLLTLNKSILKEVKHHLEIKHLKIEDIYKMLLFIIMRISNIIIYNILYS
jgi:hypothetical protein